MNIARRISQAAESGIGIKLGIGLALITTLLLAGCGDGGETTPTGLGVVAVETLSGTAAQGAAIGNANVSVKDRLGMIRSIQTDAYGKYSMNVAGMTTPFLLRIPVSNGYLYSVATAKGTANIHPFTDLIIRNWYKVQSANVETDFAGTTALAKVPTVAEINTIEAVVRNILSTSLSKAGQTNFNLLTSSFDANQTGFDQVLDNTKVVVNSTTGGVTVTATDATTGITGTIVSTTAAIDTAVTDTTKPTTPSGLNAMAAGTASVVLVWTASTDNVGVAGYNIYRDGNLRDKSPYPVYTDTSLSQTSYCYQIEAFDGAGNISAAKSSSVCATPASTADTTPPTAPTTLQATATSASQIDISWTASTSSDVVGYAVYRGALKVATVTGTSFSDTGLSSSTANTYTVLARDGAGNFSSASNSSTATTHAGIPSAPTNISAAAGDGQTTISWTAASGATSYNIYWSTSSGVSTASGTKITGVSSPYTHNGLNNATTYYYIVTAANSTGASVESAQATATPAAAVAPVTQTNSGTYTWNSSTSQLVLNTTSANITGHTTLGAETLTGVTITSTALSYTNSRGYQDSWGRPSGTAGNLLGEWPTIDCAASVLYTLTLNADNTFTITAVAGVSSNSCATTGGTTSTTATPADFAGSWTGSITFAFPATATETALSGSGSLGVVLNYSGSQVTGRVTTSDGSANGTSIFTISGTVTNGVLSFNLPSSDPTNPDCANWNMPFTATLSTDLQAMTINSSGIACGSNGGRPATMTGTATAVAGVATGTNTAIGTYTWNAATGSLAFTTTSSDFMCSGPKLGVSNSFSGITVTSTIMTWPSPDSSTWTRSVSGVANSIVGVWSTSMVNGVPFNLTFTADGTYFASGTDQCVRVWAYNWQGSYMANLQYGSAATAVSVSGPGITGSAALTYNANYGSWGGVNNNETYNVNLGTTYPSGLPYTYTFTITDANGTRTETSTVSCFQEQLATNLAPTGTVTGTPTFSWTGISDASAAYGVELRPANGNRLWENFNITGNSTVYNGPALTPGVTYNYNVFTSSSTCPNNESVAQGSFTYQ